MGKGKEQPFGREDHMMRRCEIREMQDDAEATGNLNGRKARLLFPGYTRNLWHRLRGAVFLY